MPVHYSHAPSEALEGWESTVMKSCIVHHVPKARSPRESGGLPAPLMLGVKETSSLRWVPLCFIPIYLLGIAGP